MVGIDDVSVVYQNILDSKNHRYVDFKVAVDSNEYRKNNV